MHYPLERKGGISMTCTGDYREHIEYTFHAFCKVVIRNATITAARTRSRKYKREISLEYLIEEKHYPLGTTDKYLQAPEPDSEYILTLCGDTVIFSNALLAEIFFCCLPYSAVCSVEFLFRNISSLSETAER